jgi:hypothetical protein
MSASQTASGGSTPGNPAESEVATSGLNAAAADCLLCRLIRAGLKSCSTALAQGRSAFIFEGFSVALKAFSSCALRFRTRFLACVSISALRVSLGLTESENSLTVSTSSRSLARIVSSSSGGY